MMMGINMMESLVYQLVSEDNEDVQNSKTRELKESLLGQSICLEQVEDRLRDMAQVATIRRGITKSRTY